MEKRRTIKQSLLSLLAGYREDETCDELDVHDDIELMAHLTAAAELELMRSMGLPVTIH